MVREVWEGVRVRGREVRGCMRWVGCDGDEEEVRSSRQVSSSDLSLEQSRSFTLIVDA